MVDREQIFAAVAAERRRIADLLDSLDDDALATPSLCSGWDVKTVAAHVLSTVADGLPVFLRLAARRRSLGRAIDELARRRAQASASEIAAELRQYADCPVDPPLFGPLDPLADVLVHLGDITIPLGLTYRPDPRLVTLALDFLSGPGPFGFVRLGLLRGISLDARDVNVRWGSGAEVSGPAAELMMTVTGRTGCMDALDGPALRCFADGSHADCRRSSRKPPKRGIPIIGCTRLACRQSQITFRCCGERKNVPET